MKKKKNPLHNFIRNIQFWKRWSTSPLQAEAPSLHSHAHATDTHMRASSIPSLQTERRELATNKIFSLIFFLFEQQIEASRSGIPNSKTLVTNR
jgi:hypothetical protein